MATYIELFDRYNSDVFYNRMVVAIAVAADVIRLELATTPNHVARIAWAKSAMLNPTGDARRLALAVLAQNKGLTAAQIDGSSDAALQTAVNAAIDLITG